MKNRPWQRILIAFHTLWPCLLLEIRAPPALISSHTTMVVSMVALIEEEEGTMVIEVEVEEGSTTVMVEVNTSFSIPNLNKIITHLRMLTLEVNLVVNLVVRPSRMIDLAVRFVARQVTKLLTIITEWILPIKARIHQPN